MSAASRFWDPLYGHVELTDAEMRLVQLPEVQRLRYVRMCNINSMLITGASEISRFEHCLGVLYLAKLWAGKYSLSEPARSSFIAAALLHDLQTGPFGHSFQYILEDNDVGEQFLHDDIIHGFRSQYHQKLLTTSAFSGAPFEAHRLLSNLWPTIADLIRGKGALGPLISGSLDLDNIDNVVRLAYHVGIATKDDAIVGKELALDLLPIDRALRVSWRSIERIERWQAIRKRLYELLLLDWAEFSAKAMLTKALELAVEAKIIEPEHWLLTDDELLDHLSDRTVGDVQGSRELVSRLRRGDLYSPITLMSSESVNAYQRLSQVPEKRRLEQSIAKRLRDDLGLRTPIVVHFILDKRKTERSVSVVLRETGEERIVGNDSSQLLVGIFLSNLPAKQSLIRAASSLVAQELQAIGLDNLRTIRDPMEALVVAGEENPPQLQLI